MALLNNGLAEPSVAEPNLPGPAAPDAAPVTEPTPGSSDEPANNPPPDSSDQPPTEPAAEPAAEPTSPESPETEPAATPKAEKRIRDLLTKLDEKDRTITELVQRVLETRNPEPGSRNSNSEPSRSPELTTVFDPAEIQRREAQAQQAIESADRLISLVAVDAQAAEEELRKYDLLKTPAGQVTPREMLDVLWQGKRVAQATLNAAPKRLAFLNQYARNLKAAHEQFPWLKDAADERRALAQAEFNSDPRWRDDPNADAKIAKLVEYDWNAAQRAKAKPNGANGANGKPVTTTATAQPGATRNPEPGTRNSPGPRTTAAAAPPPRAATEANNRLAAALEKAKKGSANGLVEALAMSDWGR